MSAASAAPAAGDRSICFVAHNALAALAGGNRQHAGGIERQQTTMAVWLAEHGWDVSMVVWDDAEETASEAQGVRIVRMCTLDDGLPVLRFFHPRWTSLNAALRSADADIYYYNCGDLGLGQVVAWARRRNRPVVFSVPSDPDCDPALPALGSVRERVLYRYGLTHCEHIIVQTGKQQAMLEAGFAKASTPLRMPCVGFSDAAREGGAGDRFHVLWVGRISEEKRPDWVQELARRLPQIHFTIVGGPNRDSDYARRVLSDEAALPNVSFVGRIAHEDMGPYYARADVLICTSVYEGFPNVFLEAWSVGTPVITTCDPDGLVDNEGLGAAAGDLDAMTAAIDRLAGNEAAHRRVSAAAREYFDRNHRLDPAMKAFENYFIDVLETYTGDNHV
ncbi:MAG: glycosyltransferase family 4 protein [Gammaproteobacteria bacterium]|nr:glycosyltransferase family 4 protein [Gammaproteobacteria bacterium]MBT8104808.1 glycosyltransferase family 4 protein [Gammaproteobacteria bacterium]NNK24822.1 glycosyltransferase family 4 protein [Woeseiaceae bacterium]